MTRQKVFFISILFVVMTGVAAWAVGQKLMSIQVKKGEVRSRPSFLSQIIVRLSYGDRVPVKAKSGGWARIGLPTGTGEGWIHQSALTTKKIILRAGAEDVRQAASGDEIALAGKGFNKQVEGQFRAKNPHLDFAWIDKMERFVVSQTKIQNFVKEGRLVPQGG